MADLTNWIEDVNRFQLATPPAFWLRKLTDFDPSLVLIPSRQDAVYRLAQRRPLNLPENLVNDALFNQSDTQLLASYSLIPVTTIIANPNWSNPLMFRDLADRAPWRNGGADKVISELEEAEMRIETQKRIDTELNLVDRAKDGWRLLKMKQGSTVLLQPHKLDPRMQRTPKTANR